MKKISIKYTKGGYTPTTICKFILFHSTKVNILIRNNETIKPTSSNFDPVIVLATNSSFWENLGYTFM